MESSFTQDKAPSVRLIGSVVISNDLEKALAFQGMCVFDR